jgi:1-acyl-sn-glycerol-3-phosphate acyltransferase
MGEPMDFSRYRGMENDRFVLRSITDEILYEIMRLSGQEYVDMYAATAKARIAAGKTTDTASDAPGGRTAPDTDVPQAPEDAPSPADGPTTTGQAGSSDSTPQEGPA